MAQPVRAKVLRVQLDRGHVAAVEVELLAPAWPLPARTRLLLAAPDGLALEDCQRAELAVHVTVNPPLVPPPATR
jgi:hypothetical protein